MLPQVSMFTLLSLVNSGLGWAGQESIRTSHIAVESCPFSVDLDSEKNKQVLSNLKKISMNFKDAH